MSQQRLTPHQSQYFTWLLTRRAAGGSVESLTSTLIDSQVGLNPYHEVTLQADLEARKITLLREIINQRNLGYFEQETQKLDAWADDLRLEQKINEVRRNLANANWKISTACCVEIFSRSRTKSKPSITHSSIRWKFSFNSKSKNARYLLLSGN